MRRTFMRSALVLGLPLAVVLAAPPSHAGIWRSSEEPSPANKVTTTKHVATTKQVSGGKASAKPVATAKPAPTTRTAATAKAKATAKGGALTAKPETSIGRDGQVVYHSISDWQPGSLDRENTGSEPREGGGKSRERAVEVPLSSVEP